MKGITLTKAAFSNDAELTVDNGTSLHLCGTGGLYDHPSYTDYLPLSAD